jgi:hypothetical protein
MHARFGRSTILRAAVIMNKIVILCVFVCISVSIRMNVNRCSCFRAHVLVSQTDPTPSPLLAAAFGETPGDLGVIPRAASIRSPRVARELILFQKPMRSLSLCIAGVDGSSIGKQEEVFSRTLWSLLLVDSPETEEQRCQG